ncbi:unnamed protein product [Prunus brigantina]
MVWFFQALSIFCCYEFALLVGMTMPKFIQSCVIIRGGAPYCLNFDVRAPLL